MDRGDAFEGGRHCYGCWFDHVGLALVWVRFVRLICIELPEYRCSRWNWLVLCWVEVLSVLLLDGQDIAPSTPYGDQLHETWVLISKINVISNITMLCPQKLNYHTVRSSQTCL